MKNEERKSKNRHAPLGLAGFCHVLTKKMQVPQKDKTGLLAGGASAP